MVNSDIAELKHVVESIEQVTKSLATAKAEMERAISVLSGLNILIDDSRKENYHERIKRKGIK